MISLSKLFFFMSKFSQLMDTIQKIQIKILNCYSQDIRIQDLSIFL